MTRHEAPLFSWFSLSLLVALSIADPCEKLTKGTDIYWECVTGEEIDLGVQDKADETISKGRE